MPRGWSRAWSLTCLRDSSTAQLWSGVTIEQGGSETNALLSEFAG
jgi:hypothetical protein